MSGARNCPETPRQRMIGMMYLVLTAMLALNVSSEILDGFSMVDSSLHNTINSSEMRNQAMYSDLEELAKKNPDKVREWLDKSKEVKKQSDNLFDYIEKFKRDLIKLADKENANDSALVHQIQAKDNLDKAGEYAIIGKNGKELKSRIDAYRSFLQKLSANDPKKQAIYSKVFSTEANKKGKPWENSMFEMMPIAAVVTILTKYQSDIRASEAEIVQFLKAQTDASDFRVNKITALVVPNSRYVIRGGRYSSQIVLSAVDSTKRPDFYIGNTPVRNGQYEVNCGKSGSFNYSGTVRLMGNDGIMRSYPFKSDYVVGDPAATLSNDALNVVYRGIDNVFSISVPGVAAEHVSVRVQGGSAQKTSNGKFIVRANQDGEIQINVYAKIEGKDLPMGGGSYRVKYLPNPTAFMTYNDGSGIQRQFQEGKLTKRILKSNVALIASYGENELVKANFTITSFTTHTVFGTINTTGNRLTSKMLADIDKLEGGDVLTFKNIKAVGPDGRTRSLGLIQVEI